MLSSIIDEFVNKELAVLRHLGTLTSIVCSMYMVPCSVLMLTNSVNVEIYDSLMWSVVDEPCCKKRIYESV